MKWTSCIVLVLVVLACSNLQAQVGGQDSFPPLISSLKIPTPLEFCGERVPAEIQDIRERLEKELLLTLWDRPQVLLWLKRSRRFLPHIEEMLRQGQMPDDLKYIAIAESALRPHAGSRKGAIGFWQFTAYTGRKYGLLVNSRVDERRNVFASTRAAIRYLKDLRETFGSWSLAAAAYNMGEEGLMAELLEQGTSSYYHLYLPLETQRYVFRLLSVKLIFSNPDRYGFHLTEQDYYPPVVFDHIQMDCDQDMPIRIIAQAAGTHFKVIKDLNPEIRGHYLAQGTHTILVPKGSSEGFQARYQELIKQWLADRKERIYVVQQGDNLSAIADRFNVPLAALIIWNRLDLKAPIHPGDQLVIHRNQVKLGDIDSNEHNAGTGPTENE
jgi:membrane-bound lytic murein transglycosylase D